MNNTRLGNILIIIGVCMWGLYALAKFQFAYAGPVTPFLIVHLLFVVPGAFLAGRGWTRRLKELLDGAPEPVPTVESDGRPG